MNPAFPYDTSLKVGDLISTFHEGYYILVKIEERLNKENPLFHYKKAYNSDGIEDNYYNIVISCDAYYCQRASKRIVKAIEELEQKKKNLENILLNESAKGYYEAYR